MVDAVLCLHDGGLVHGDVKPQNFLCYGVDYFSLTLIDMDSLSRDRDTTSIDSTVLYSMEDWYPVPSYEADVWALGLSLYALVSHQKIMQNWGYGEYRKRDQQLPQYVDGYGALDEVLRLCLSRTNQHLSVISGMIKARLRWYTIHIYIVKWWSFRFGFGGYRWLSRAGSLDVDGRYIGSDGLLGSLHPGEVYGSRCIVARLVLEGKARHPIIDLDEAGLRTQQIRYLFLGLVGLHHQGPIIDLLDVAGILLTIHLLLEVDVALDSGLHGLWLQQQLNISHFGWRGSLQLLLEVGHQLDARLDLRVVGFQQQLWTLLYLRAWRALDQLPKIEVG